MSYEEELELEELVLGELELEAELELDVDVDVDVVGALPTASVRDARNLLNPGRGGGWSNCF